MRRPEFEGLQAFDRTVHGLDEFDNIVVVSFVLYDAFALKLEIERPLRGLKKLDLNTASQRIDEIDDLIVRDLCWNRTFPFDLKFEGPNLDHFIIYLIEVIDDVIEFTLRVDRVSLSDPLYPVRTSDDLRIFRFIDDVPDVLPKDWVRHENMYSPHVAADDHARPL